MGTEELRGIFAVKLPVSALARSRAWYERVFGFEVDIEFPDDDGVVRGVAGWLPGSGQTMFALRESPAHASGVAGFNLVNFAVADRASLEGWVSRLDDLGVQHSPIIDATIGWIVVLDDPDGIELHLYSQERHGIDQTGRRGYGRHVDAGTDRSRQDRIQRVAETTNVDTAHAAPTTVDATGLWSTPPTRRCSPQGRP